MRPYSLSLRDAGRSALSFSCIGRKERERVEDWECAALAFTFACAVDQEAERA